MQFANQKQYAIRILLWVAINNSKKKQPQIILKDIIVDENM